MLIGFVPLGSILHNGEELKVLSAVCGVIVGGYGATSEDILSIYLKILSVFRCFPFR